MALQLNSVACDAQVYSSIVSVGVASLHVSIAFCRIDDSEHVAEIAHHSQPPTVQLLSLVYASHVEIGRLGHRPDGALSGSSHSASLCSSDFTTIGFGNATHLSVNVVHLQLSDL